MEAHHMNHEKLFEQLDKVLNEIDRLDKENPTGPDEETDPRIVKLLDEADRITNELDPIIRETFQDDPEKLAEWDEIMRMRDDPEEEDDK
jgi:hypothetical protein